MCLKFGDWHRNDSVIPQDAELLIKVQRTAKYENIGFISVTVTILRYLMHVRTALCLC